MEKGTDWPHFGHVFVVMVDAAGSDEASEGRGGGIAAGAGSEPRTGVVCTVNCGDVGFVMTTEARFGRGQTDQIKAAIHPTPVAPKTKLTKKMGQRYGWLRCRAIAKGRKKTNREKTPRRISKRRPVAVSVSKDSLREVGRIEKDHVKSDPCKLTALECV